MDSAPALKIFTDELASPVAVHTPSSVPLHWKAAVKQGLDRNDALGVLEKVPVNPIPRGLKNIRYYVGGGGFCRERGNEGFWLYPKA